MRRDVPPQKISKFHLVPSHSVPVGSSEKSIFKISKNGEYVWTTRGCNLEIYTCPHMRRVNHWSFPTLSKNSDVYISSVEEFPSGGGPGGYRVSSAPHLLVVLAGVNYLCLFDICNGSVLKCIQMPFPVSCLEVISYQGGACLQTRALFPSLRLFFGLVAVGTESGNLLLVDLCLDETQGSDELTPAQVLEISGQAVELPQLREQALEHNDHLYLTLSENSIKHNTLLYKGSQNRTLGEINADYCCVTAIHYVPHATLLVVGFSFGCFQLWNLQDLSIVYGSPITVDSSPVVKFAFQEPENDPRNFCYLWVVYGHSPLVTNNELSLTTASLYSLGYERKDWQDGFGYLYQNFNHCILKFEHPLTVDPFNQANEAHSGSSNLVAFGMIQDNHLTTNRQHDIEDTQADECNNQDLSLCLMVWEAWEPQEPPGYFMLLFDINQWYQAQMPTTVRNPGLCSFLGVFSLVELMSNRNTYGDISLKDVYISLKSLRRFKTLSYVDEMYYPSSFGFRATCLMECGVAEVTYLGIQRQLLWELQNLGPSYLRDPTEIFIHCRHSGLLPYSENISLKQKREALLSLALEYDLLRYLKECILQAPTADYTSSGLSLRFVSDWAWKTTSQIKAAVDRLCLPLFNCSGQELHQNSLALLYNYSSQLQALACLYRIMQSQAAQAITQAGFEELSVHEEVVQLLCVYLQVNLWLHQYCCLLPEHAEGEAYGENEVAYPASHLIQAYDQRRRELHKLHSSVGLTDLLLIDGLMSKLNDQVPLHWERSAHSDGNSSSLRLYPPPSLFAFLNIYLVSGVPTMDKHCLTLYLLLDMADFLSHKQSHLEERLMQFPAAFLMPPSIVKIVQGFWMLDRKDFAKATTFLTDPVVRSEDLDHMLHSRVIKSLLFQGQEKHALSYINIRKPPLDTPEDIKLHLSLLLSNRLIIEAYNFQRQRSDEDLLNHFFLGCQQTGNMCALLELPLRPSEEQALIKFLTDSSNPSAKEMLILYLLQRHRPLEALEFTDKLHRKDEPGSLSSSLVKQFIRILPPAQVNLAKELSKPLSRMYENQVSVPLSSLSVRKGNLIEPVSRSHHLHVVKEALHNVWSKNKNEEQSPLRTRSGLWKLNSMPFIGSPPISDTGTNKNESELVYATPVGKRPSSSLLDIMESPRLSSKEGRRLDIVRPIKRIASERRDSRPCCSEALLLLQTPPIKRVVPDLKVCAPNSGRSQLSVPTSILKGSHSRAIQSDSQVDVPVLHAGMKYCDPGAGDLSETDMELQECISTSASEDADYENTDPVRQTLTSLRKGRMSVSPTLNISFDSPGFHNSDEVLFEDEDVTLNFSMQRRRENVTSLARRHMRSKKFDHLFKDLSAQMSHKRCDASFQNTTANPASFTSTHEVKSPISSTSNHRYIFGGENQPQYHSSSLSEDYREPRSTAVALQTARRHIRSRNFDHLFKDLSTQMSHKRCDISTQNTTANPSSITCTHEIKSQISSTSNYAVEGENQPQYHSSSFSEEYREPRSTALALQAGSDAYFVPDTIEEANAMDVQYESADKETADYSFSTTEKASMCSPVHQTDDKLNEENLELRDINVLQKTQLDDQIVLNVSGTCETSEVVTSTDKDLDSSFQTENELQLELSDDEKGGVENIALLEIPEEPVDNETMLQPSSTEVFAYVHREEIEGSVVTMEVDLATSKEPDTIQRLENIEYDSLSFEAQEVSPIKIFEETGQFDVISDTSVHISLRSKETATTEGMFKYGSHQFEENALAPNETCIFDVNAVDTQSSSPQTLCLPNVVDDANNTSFLEENVDEIRDLSVISSPVKPNVMPRLTRRKARETLDSAHILPSLRELSSVSSSEQSPPSSVFTTPDKNDSIKTRLRSRTESRASSDSSPQAIRETEKRKGRTKQWSNTPPPQLIQNLPDRASGRKVTRSSKKTTRQRNQDSLSSFQSPYIPEEPEEIQAPSIPVPEEVEELATDPGTPKPALPFVFSPPSTRSWSRRKKSSASEKNSLKEKPGPEGIGLLPPKHISRHTDKETGPTDTSDWSNYINLISPFTGKEPRTRRSSIASRASTSSQHSMTLRTGGIKTRTFVKLK